MVKNKKHWTEKNWHCLTSVKGHIERNVPEETIKDFNGYMLTTNKCTYTLYDSCLNVLPITAKKRKNTRKSG
jgi:hypothetical protein